MQYLINTILSNPVYIAIAGIAIVIILFLLIKKLLKFLAYACILFIAFLAYVHLTGGSVKETITDVQNKGKDLIKDDSGKF